MAKYIEVLTNRRELQKDMTDWESKGYEIVSHSVCPNNNISLLVKIIGKDAAVKDDDFDLIVLSALRYALPRHSYMPATVRDYIIRHWTELRNKHWAILSDIRDYVYGVVEWNEDHKENESYMDKIDLNEWVKFYNKLLTLEDLHLNSNFQHLKEPISLDSENGHNPN
mgnify:CR=1 FL=1